MEHLELQNENNDISTQNTIKKGITAIHLISTIIGIVGIGFGAYVSITNRVTALETQQVTSKETDNRIEKKIDFLIELQLKDSKNQHEQK